VKKNENRLILDIILHSEWHYVNYIPPSVGSVFRPWGNVNKSPLQQHYGEVQVW